VDFEKQRKQIRKLNQLKRFMRKSRGIMLQKIGKYFQQLQTTSKTKGPNPCQPKEVTELHSNCLCKQKYS
jgi:hypothetical protein